METVTKSDIVDRLRDVTGLPRSDSSVLVDALLDLMRDNFFAGRSIKLPGFGTFQVRQKAARLGRNPQTRGPIVIQPRQVLSFKPSLVLRQSLNSDRKDGRSRGR